jgi:aspartyl-tRNA(Asn)/glutamyl-tRNA(Gln) amidotransferase subunit A
VVTTVNLLHCTAIAYSLYVPALHQLTLAQAAEAIRTRQLSPVELTRHCLGRIQKYDLEMNAFIAVAHDSAIFQAKTAEKEITAGNYRGPLHGIPLALKDLIDSEAERTTAASNVLSDHVALKDAEVTRRLRAAGGIFLGKTNLHEFAYGGSGVISAYGPVQNPWDAERITGGSSSGSAAAVAAGMCFMAVGTDTAGSIRLPGAYCGIVGLKPTHGLVSTEGVVELSRSLDHVGPLTRSVEDSRITMEILADMEQEDAPSSPRFAVVRKGFLDGAQTDIVRAWEEAVAAIAKSLNQPVREIEIPINTDRTLQKAESYQFHKKYLAERSSLYDPQTLERINSGRDTRVEEIEKLRNELVEFRRKSAAVFNVVDIIATLTVPIAPPRLSEVQGTPQLRQTELLMLRNTRPFDVLGWPTITIPCGLTASGLPVGLQLSAGFRRDRFLLDVAARCERILSFSAKPAILG